MISTIPNAKQRQVLKLICRNVGKFPHELVTVIPESLMESATELQEMRLIEPRADGFLLTKKGKEWCEFRGWL